jgi:hypothetical protein
MTHTLIMRNTVKVFSTVLLLVFLMPTLTSAAQGTGAPRLILTGVTVDPAFHQVPGSKDMKIVQFMLAVTYRGPDYSFEDLSTPYASALLCDVGMVRKPDGKFDVAYSKQVDVLYKGPLPLKDNQRLTFIVDMPIPVKYNGILRRQTQTLNNICSINMNLLINFKSVGADLQKQDWGKEYGFAFRAYALKLLNNKVQISPRADWGY